MNQWIPLIAVIFGTVIGAFGSLFLKKGSAKLHRNNLLMQFFNKSLILGIFLFVFSAVIYIIALKYGELSLLYPVTSLAYVWVAFLSLKLLKEKMNLHKWIGICLIIIGVIFITH